MAFWLVSRYSGEQNWIELDRIPCDSTLVDWLDPGVTPGDIVLGALPMPVVAQLNVMGVHVVQLALAQADGAAQNLAQLAAAGLTAVCYKAAPAERVSFSERLGINS